MKLGAAVSPEKTGDKPDWAGFARFWRDQGVDGASVFFDQPISTSLSEAKGILHIFKDHGFETAQTNGWYECLVNPQENLRREGILGMQKLCALGAVLESPSVYVRPGGLNPAGPWYPHPDNHLPQTFDRLVDSLKQVCRAAEQEGVQVAIEGHVLSVLDTPQKIRDVIEAVGSPALKFNLDPVNFIGTVQSVHHPATVIDELFEICGQYIIAAHIKDCRLENQLVVHIQEVVLGEGVLDYRSILPRFQALGGNLYAIIEHLPADKVLLAKERLQAMAKSIGINLGRDQR